MKKVWQPVTLVSLEIRGHILPFWKPPIKIYLEPDCQGGRSILKVRQAMLKSLGLLNKLLYASDLLWAPLYMTYILHTSVKSTIMLWGFWIYFAWNSISKGVEGPCWAAQPIQTNLGQIGCAVLEPLELGFHAKHTLNPWSMIVNPE